jgi:hypothetical protein
MLWNCYVQVDGDSEAIGEYEQGGVCGGDGGDREMGGEENGGDREELDEDISCIQMHTVCPIM